MNLKRFLALNLFYVISSLTLVTLGNVLSFCVNDRVFTIYEGMVVFTLSNIMFEVGGIRAEVSIKKAG